MGIMGCGGPSKEQQAADAAEARELVEINNRKAERRYWLGQGNKKFNNEDFYGAIGDYDKVLQLCARYGPPFPGLQRNLSKEDIGVCGKDGTDALPQSNWGDAARRKKKAQKAVDRIEAEAAKQLKIQAHKKLCKEIKDIEDEYSYIMHRNIINYSNWYKSNPDMYYEKKKDILAKIGQ